MLLSNFFNKLRGIDDDFYDELEETLILSDIGAETSDRLIEELRDEVSENRIKSQDGVKEFLNKKLTDIMNCDEKPETYPAVYLIVGVNGVGKTTTCGKLALKFKAEGKKVLLAAADTFRAAATEQLTMWAERTDCEIIASHEGADPGSVIFDACTAAKARKTDVLICDTAGRLNNKKNLMAELKKLYDIIAREYPEARRETLIVLDATTGQNALEQARQFSEIADVTGTILTKMDGTAKGGIAVAIKEETGLTPRYIGVGEKAEDLKSFDRCDYINRIME